MNELEQLRAQAEAINARIEELSGRVQVRHNELGYYAAKECKDSLANIKLLTNSIDIEKSTEQEIDEAFRAINSASYRAFKNIERDAAERSANADR